jgi:hypothetical protein
MADWATVTAAAAKETHMEASFGSPLLPAPARSRVARLHNAARAPATESQPLDRNVRLSDRSASRGLSGQERWEQLVGAVDAAFDERVDLSPAHRMGEVETLAGVGSELNQRLILLGGFDAFGYYGQA